MIRSLTVLSLIVSFTVSCTISQAQTSNRDTTTVPAAPPLPPYSIDELERRTFHFFWDLIDTNYQVPDRWPTKAFSSIAATGFGLSAYLVGVERGWITRAQATERVLKTLEILKSLPQGDAPNGMSGYKGFFYHFLDHNKSQRYRDVELSTIDSGLLLAGILSCQTYFDQNTPEEKAIREAADFIYRRVEWDWMLNKNNRISMGWKPERGFIQAEWFGYTEAMILYVLALGSPTHPIPETAWKAWTQNYYWDTYQGQEHVNFGPLFGHQYSHVWIDFKGIQDDYMRKKGIDYAENTRRATLANWSYCKQNPKKYKDYSDKIWGLTACDGPVDWLAKHDPQRRCIEQWEQFMGYSARGVASDYLTDDGTIAPTAAGGSVPFAPEICLPALESMWTNYGDSLVGAYGFKDAFNPSFNACGKLPKGWFDIDYLGIDQGPIILMLENYRSGFLWNLMKKNPYIRKGLFEAGFKDGWLGPDKRVLEYEDEVLPNEDVPTNPLLYFNKAILRDAGDALPYRLLKPSNFLETNRIKDYHITNGNRLFDHETRTKELKIPLVIFLHGSGERGFDNEAQLRNGVLAFCEPANWEKHPCFMLVPQCPQTDQWASYGKAYKENPTASMRLLIKLIEKTITENPAIDPARVYITGLSMGGYGTFDILTRCPDLFAAAMPLCGGGDPAQVAKFSKIPMWVFHGVRDEAVMLERSSIMIKALKAANSTVKFTEYTTLGHAVWQETYYNPAVLDWLFTQHK